MKSFIALTQQQEAKAGKPQGNEMLDFYGDLVKNNQKVAGGPILAVKVPRPIKPKSYLAQKMNLHKEKLIFKFLKSQH